MKVTNSRTVTATIKQLSKKSSILH